MFDLSLLDRCFNDIFVTLMTATRIFSADDIFVSIFTTFNLMDEPFKQLLSEYPSIFDRFTNVFLLLF